MKPQYQIIYDKNIATFGHLSGDKIMALTTYAEARGEPEEGKIAVGTVILERVDHRSWDGNTIQEVCLWPYQFSCYLINDRNYVILFDISNHWDSEIIKNPVLNDCWNISIGLIAGNIPRDPDLAKVNCCQYLTVAAKKNVDWWKTMKFIKKIGAHEFYG